MKNFKKNIAIYLFLISTTILFSQEKTKEIKLDKKDNLKFLKVSNHGNILLKIDKLISLDKNLNKNFEIDIVNKFSNGFVEISKNLEYIINSDQLINKKGIIREYPYGKRNTYNKIDKASGLNPVFHFFNDYGWSVIGLKSGRFNVKSKYNKDDIFIFNLRNEDVKGETFVLKSPNLITNNKSVSWYLMGENFKNSFYLYTTDNLKRDSHKSVHHIVENSYKGEVISYSNLEVNLDKDKFFLTSQKIVKGTNISNYNADYSHYYIDNTDNSILIYGYYSKRKTERFNKSYLSKGRQSGYANGFYAFKFKKDGELIWKSYYPFIGKEKTTTQSRFLNFTKFKEKGVFNSHLLDLSGVFEINYKTGKENKNSSNLIDFFDSKKILKNNQFLKLKIFTGLSRGTFKDKKTNKNNITPSLLTAMLFKPEIKDFMFKRALKKKNVTYDAKFSKENIYLTEITNDNNQILISTKNKKLTIFKF